MLNAQGQMPKVDADSDRQIVVSEHACVYQHGRTVCKVARLWRGLPMMISIKRYWSIDWLLAEHFNSMICKNALPHRLDIDNIRRIHTSQRCHMVCSCSWRQFVYPMPVFFYFIIRLLCYIFISESHKTSAPSVLLRASWGQNILPKVSYVF